MNSGLLNRYLLLLGISLTTFVSYTVRAAEYRPSAKWVPEWVKSRKGVENSSFLSNLNPDVGLTNEFESFSASKILSSKRTAELKQRYQDINRSTNLKRQFGLSNKIDEQRNRDDIQGFSKSVWGSLRESKINKNIDGFRKATKNPGDLGAMRKPVLVAGALAAFSMGTPVSVAIDANTQVIAESQVVEKRGKLDVVSSVVNGSVAYSGNIDPNQPLQSEKVSLSLSRGLPIWNLNSGVSYGDSSKTVSASLSKPITDNLTCIVDTRRKLPNSPAELSVPSQESVQLQYGIHF